MRGTWQTTGGGGSAGPALLVIGAVLLLGSGGAVAAVSAALIDALIAVLVVVALTAAAVGAFLVHRARHPEVVSRMIPRPQFHELGGTERPEIGQAAPRELHQHTHYHWHGAEQPAEIRRIEPPGQ